jgi:hypothetical protein
MQFMQSSNHQDF